MSDDAKLKVSPRIIPAEQAKHLPRWELGTFPLDPAQASKVRPQSRQELEEREHRLRLAQQRQSVAEQAERARREAAQQAAQAIEKEQRAREEAARKVQELAFEEGYQQGHTQGLQDARQDLTHLAEIAQQLEQTQQALEAELAPRVVELAVRIARQVVARELVQDPALILEVTRQAMTQLSGHASHRILKLHPKDGSLLQQHLGTELSQAGWQLQTDPSLTRGGCLIVSTDTKVDASLETRWGRTLATLGNSLSWTAADLAPPTPSLPASRLAEDNALELDHHDGEH